MDHLHIYVYGDIINNGVIVPDETIANCEQFKNYIRNDALQIADEVDRDDPNMRVLQWMFFGMTHLEGRGRNMNVDEADEEF